MHATSIRQAHHPLCRHDLEAGGGGSRDSGMGDQSAVGNGNDNDLEYHLTFL